MKDTVLYALNGILLVAVIVLFFLVLKPGGKKSAKSIAPKAGVELKESGLIAFVDLDTLEENYILFKEKKAELQKKQTNIENTLQQRVAAPAARTAAAQRGCRRGGEGTAVQRRRAAGAAGAHRPPAGRAEGPLASGVRRAGRAGRARLPAAGRGHPPAAGGGAAAGRTGRHAEV